MAGAASLQLGDAPLAPDRPFPLRWAWHWRSEAGQVAELDRLVAVARADTREDDPAPPAADALARSRALGWRAVLAAHEAAWEDALDGGRGPHRGRRRPAAGAALRRVPSDQRRQSRGRAGLDRRARPHRRRLFRPRLLGHRDLPAALLHRGLAGGGAGAADVPLPHAARRARQGGADRLQGRALRLGIGRHRRGDHARARGGARRRAGRHPDRHGWSTTSAPTSPTRSGSTGAPPATTTSSCRPARRSCWRRPGSGRPAPWRRRTAGGTSAT